ncbi:tetratricopeptide repeat protein [Archangium gephyra]|uniref:tetratricopeptide repeat protein n=1 Tax=Archangium gephyra TaxID=48 RepID=UPI0035D5141E
MEHRIIRRLFAIAPLCALTACATTGSAQSSELAELKAEVRAMRETQARLEKRLERVELHASVSQSRASVAAAPAREGSTSAPPAAAASSGYSTPELAVVKLKPRNEPAPALPTRVAVVEPAPDDMEMFISSAPEEDAAPAAAQVSEPSEELDSAVLDAEFEQAVAALRTGNVEGGVTRLQAFAEEHPRHPRADNALYFSGLGQMGLKDHPSAVKSFERLIASYPAGDAVLDGMLRLAECRLRLNQKDDARALYTRILTQFPGTAAATQAEQRLASLH